MSAPVTQQVALQIIRTWAAFERDHPEMHVLVPEHVLKICDEALGIDRARGEGAVVKAMTDRYARIRAALKQEACRG